MPRVSNAAQLARRERVFALWTRGLPAAAIARAAGCDRRTAQRDIAYLGHQAAAELDVDAELHRLLHASRAIEAQGWTTGDYALALAGQRQTTAVVALLADRSTEARLTALEAAMSAEEARVAPPLSLNGAARNGHRGAPGSPYAPD